MRLVGILWVNLLKHWRDQTWVIAYSPKQRNATHSYAYSDKWPTYYNKEKHEQYEMPKIV